MPGRDPNWAREELVLALDLYFGAGRRALDDSDARVVALSELLRAIPLHGSGDRSGTFRSPNSVSLKLQNLAAVDRGKGGMPHSSALDRAMVEEFKRDHGRLTGLAATFREVPELAAAPDEDDGARVYPEGRYAYRIHRSRERSPRLARDKKRQAAQHGRLACEVCGLAPEQLYPENGDRALECHHIIPLSSLSGVKSTRLEDLALVCASCHRVLHSSNPPVVPVTLSKSLTATVRLEGRGA